MIRPEARQTLLRWRDALIGGAILILGIWCGMAAYGLVSVLGWAIAGLGAVVLIAGVQRGRFRTPGKGPGIVTVDEKRVVYFGPHSGGVIDIGALVRLEHLTDTQEWRLTQDTGDTLTIPVHATGAEQLFDVFAGLEGISIERMVQATQTKQQSAVQVIWQLPSQSSNIRQLH